MPEKFVENMLGGAKKKGGNTNIFDDNLIKKIAHRANEISGGAKKKDKKKKETGKKKTKKGKYKEFLDKKYSKEQLLKKCKEMNIKVTTRKNGNIKPIKKETLINKILKLKFS
jgi:hypothetical protein